jgi:hypothetical protein
MLPCTVDENDFLAPVGQRLVYYMLSKQNGGSQRARGCLLLLVSVCLMLLARQVPEG